MPTRMPQVNSITTSVITQRSIVHLIGNHVSVMRLPSLHMLSLWCVHFSIYQSWLRILWP